MVGAIRVLGARCRRRSGVRGKSLTTQVVYVDNLEPDAAADDEQPVQVDVEPLQGGADEEPIQGGDELLQGDAVEEPIQGDDELLQTNRRYRFAEYSISILQT